MSLAINSIRSLKSPSSIRGAASLNAASTLNAVRSLGNPNNYYVPEVKIVGPINKKANSFADIITGDLVEGTTELQNTLRDSAFSWSRDIPILNRVTGTLVFLKDQYADPFIVNGFSGQATKEVLLNSLNNISETLDLFSNVIKSQSPLAGGEFLSGESLANSWGLGADGTRHNYNYDSGNFFVDVLLETVSDPLNVLTFGGKSVAKTALDSVQDVAVKTLKETAERAGISLADDVVADIANAAIKAGSEGVEGMSYATIKNYMKDTTVSALQQAAKDVVTNDEVEKMLTQSTIESLTKSHSMYRLYSAASKVSQVASNVDDILTKAAVYTTPLLVPVKAAKPLFKKMLNGLVNYIIEQATKYNFEKTLAFETSKLTKLIDEVYIKNNATLNTLEKNMRGLLTRLGTNATEIQELYGKFLNKGVGSGDVMDAFLKYLRDVRYINIDEMPTEELNMFKEYIIEASKGPTALYMASKITRKKFEDFNAELLNKTVNDNRNYVGKYNYINDVILKGYGLDNLDKYIDNVVKNSNNIPVEQLRTIARVLDMNGVNLNNAKQIAAILRSPIVDKELAIKKVLSKTNKVSTDYVKLLKHSEQRINRESNRVINQVFKEEIPAIGNEIYADIIKNKVKNLSVAIDNLKSNKDFDRNLQYLRAVLRKSDITNTDLIDPYIARFKEAVPEELYNGIDDTVSFIKDTQRIMEAIDNKSTVVSDINSWWNKLDGIYSTNNRMLDGLRSLDDPEAVAIRQFLNDVNKTIDLYKADSIKDELVNYVGNVFGMMYPQLSHKGMFNVFVQNTQLSTDPVIREALNELSIKDSVTRMRVVNGLIKALEDANLTSYAANIRKTIAQVDTVNNLLQLLDTDIVTTISIPNKTLDSIKTLVFDTIQKQGNVIATDIAIDPKLQRDIVNSIMGNIVNNSTINISLNKVTGAYYADTIDELRTQIERMFRYYIDAQTKIDLDGVTLYNVYDVHTISGIELLSNNINKIAANIEATPEELSSYQELLEHFKILADSTQTSVDTIIKENENIFTLIDHDMARNILTQKNIAYNLFNASIESGTYTMKYVVRKDVMNNFGLAQDMFEGTNSEYVKLMNKLDWIKEVSVIDENILENRHWIEQLREALIKTYEVPNVLYAPKNPEVYFGNLDNAQVYYWYQATIGNLSAKNKKIFIGNANKVMQEMRTKINNGLEYISTLEEITKDPQYIKDSDLAFAVNIANNVDAMKQFDAYTDEAFLTTLKSLEDLGEYQQDVIRYIDNEIAAKHDIIKEINDIENIDSIVRGKGTLGNADDYAKLTGLSYGYEKYNNKGQIEMYIDAKIGLSISVARMNPEQLATYIYKNTPGSLVFNNTNIVRTLQPDGRVTWSGLDNVFSFTDAELADAGLKLYKENDLYFIRLTDNRVHNAALTFNDISNELDEGRQRYAKLINKYKVYLNMDEMEVPDELITVESLHKDLWNSITEKHSDFFGDLGEQKLYQKLDQYGNNKFFNRSFERLNATVIGGYDALDVVNKMYQVDTDIVTHSKSMAKNTLSGLMSFLNRSNKINKYLTIFFNEDFSLDNPLFHKMFEESTSEEIKQFFAKGDYVAVILRSDKKDLPKVFKYNVTDTKSLQQAIKAKAILVPTETFRNMQFVVNERAMSNDILSIYKRVVMPTYKTMYLTTLGFPFRNALDSLVIKNMNELGPVSGNLKIFQYEYSAYKALKLHDKIQKEVLEITAGETFNKEVLIGVLAKYPEETQNLYFLMDMFINSSASGGYSKAFGEYLEQYNTFQNPKDIRMAWERIYNDKILSGKQLLNPINAIREVNNTIEQTARFGLLLGYIDQGKNINDAIKQVTKTHFDYKSKSTLLDICEQFFWFSVFPLNNMAYYVNGGFTRNPFLLKLIMDTQTASWNNGEYTYEELKKTNFLAYHAMVGNLRIGNTIVKTSPSLFDFFNLVSDPVGQMRDRLNPFIRVPLTTDTIEDLNPLSSQIRNIKKLSEGNLVPSITSDINDYAWIKYLGNGRTASNWNAYPKRIRRPTSRFFSRYYYNSKYRWFHNYNRLSILTINKYRTDPMYAIVTPKAVRNIKNHYGVKQYRI